MTEEETWHGGARKVIVVYSGRADFPILKLLKPGFRHCFAIVEVAPYWIVMDGLSDRFALAILEPRGLARYLVRLHRKGYRCQVARAPRKRAPGLRLRPMTCVETVKRVLGITKLRILTPFDLFIHMRDLNVDKQDH
jgi:hypothetical protein